MNNSDFREVYEWLTDITETLETLTEQMKGLTGHLRMLSEEDDESEEIYDKDS